MDLEKYFRRISATLNLDWSRVSVFQDSADKAEGLLQARKQLIYTGYRQTVWTQSDSRLYVTDCLVYVVRLQEDCSNVQAYHEVHLYEIDMLV